MDVIDSNNMKIEEKKGLLGKIKIDILIGICLGILGNALYIGLSDNAHYIGLNNDSQNKLIII